jgi:DNA-binding transcriptional LysR family regulator
MRINFGLLDLRVFLAIFDCGHFHKAAELLNLSLSRRLRTMEARLGTPLFERSTRSVVPTSAARQLEPMVRRLPGGARLVVPVDQRLGRRPARSRHHLVDPSCGDLLYSESVQAVQPAISPHSAARPGSLSAGGARMRDSRRGGIRHQHDRLNRDRCYVHAGHG